MPVNRLPPFIQLDAQVALRSVYGSKGRVIDRNMVDCSIKWEGEGGYKTHFHAHECVVLKPWEDPVDELIASVTEGEQNLH